MLQEAIDRLIELGQETQAVQILQKPGNPNASLVFESGKEVYEIPHERNPIQARVLDLESLRRAIDTLVFDDYELWVNEGGIVMLLDAEGQRQNRVTLNLPSNKMFTHLARTWTWKKPKDVRKWIYQTCGSVSIEPANLDAILSEVRFLSQDEEEHGVSKSKDTMGRQIRNEVLGIDGVPDLVTFSFLPWPTIEEDYQQPVKIPCRLMIDASERTIELYPVDGMAEEMKTLAVRRLIEQIIEVWEIDPDIVFAGTP